MLFVTGHGKPTQLRIALFWAMVIVTSRRLNGIPAAIAGGFDKAISFVSEKYQNAGACLIETSWSAHEK
jgi:hypothetical protein